MHPLTRRTIDRTPRRLRPGVELLARTVDDSFHDRVPGLAAEIAFFALLSLPPLLLTVLGAVGEVGDLFDRSWRLRLVQEIQSAASLLLSRDGLETFNDYLQDVLLTQSEGSIIGIGFLITVFSASRVLRVITTALTIAYDLESQRPPWQNRLWGVGLTLAGLLVAVAVGPFVIAGPDAGETLSRVLGGVPGLPEVWAIAYWPTAAAVLTALLTGLYHFAAPWRTPFRRDLPGALLAMTLWLLGTVGLRVYVGQAIGQTYGFIATPLIILLWMYVSGFVLLLGAEFNAEIEKMWPTITGRRAHAANGPPHDLADRGVSSM